MERGCKYKSMYSQILEDSVLTSDTMGLPGGQCGWGQEERFLWTLGRR